MFLEKLNSITLLLLLTLLTHENNLPLFSPTRLPAAVQLGCIRTDFLSNSTGIYC